MYEMNFVRFWKYCNFIHLHYENTVQCLPSFAWVIFCKWHKKRYLQSACCYQRFANCLLSSSLCQLPIVISALQITYYHQHSTKRLLSTALCKAHIIVSALQIACCHQCFAKCLFFPRLAKRLLTMLPLRILQILTFQYRRLPQHK